MGNSIIAVIFLASAIRVREYERGVIFRLGRLVGAKGPGLFLCRTIYRCKIKIDLRVVTMDDVPKQSLITRDNVPVTVTR